MAAMDIQHFTIEAAANNVRAVRAALADGIDINGRERKNHWTALHWAVYTYSLDAMALLLAAGADPNLQGRIGDTPLHRAVPRAQDRTGAIRMLIAAGADPSIENKYEISAIEHARKIVGFPIEAFDDWHPA